MLSTGPATRGGMVKKSRLSDYDTNRTAGLIAINLREGDEVVSAFTVSAQDDILLVSRNGMSLRFTLMMRRCARWVVRPRCDRYEVP